MIRIVLLGGGNIACHLATHFQKSEVIDLVQVYNRTLEHLDFLDQTVLKTTDLNALAEADIYILAISDDAISEVSKKMTMVSGLVLHTSGGKHLNTLQGAFSKGVLYFPQSFTKGKPIDFSQLPVCIETENESDLQLLQRLARTFSENIYEINSEQRSYLHVSAVFVNNFVNHLYALGNEICTNQKIPFEILMPLIRETAAKIEKLSPEEAQTGPAVRNDQKTIEIHKVLLGSEHREIYTMLTNSIQKHGKKL